MMNAQELEKIVKVEELEKRVKGEPVLASSLQPLPHPIVCHVYYIPSTQQLHCNFTFLWFCNSQTLLTPSLQC